VISPLSHLCYPLPKHLTTLTISVTNHAMPRRRQQEDTTIATTNNAVLFFGAANPNGYLSQMFESEFTHYNKTYNCSEHFFQYAKAALFKDANSMRKILAATDPERQKALGKKVTPFDAEEWELGSESHSSSRNI
jgi:predicted NAD-dependent protein-ADP-ribosyltransferase YbiA (DUF1768 family)